MIYTAGINETQDVVEKIGVEKNKKYAKRLTYDRKMLK